MINRILFASCGIVATQSWGGDGHAIITAIASSIVSDQGALFLRRFLGNDLIEPSRWADTDEALLRYPQSDSYHFSHTPYRDCKPFDMKRDCRHGSCIVTGLADAINTSIDPTVSREERVDALKFVLHLIADIHQPLHTGFREDAGGTHIALTHPANLSLHEVWDYGLIDHATNDWNQIVAELVKSFNSNDGRFIQRISKQTDLIGLLNMTNSSIVPNIVEYVASIATETTMTSTCKVAYTDETGAYIERSPSTTAMLSEEYFRTRISMMKIQMAKAAVRLALLIDAISTAYDQRLSAFRDAAREARIAARLFQSLQAEAARANREHDPFVENYFGVLSIEFDIEAFVYEFEETSIGSVDSEITSSRSPSKAEAKALKVARKRAAAKKRIEKEKKAEKKRVANMVEGIDLSALVLIKRGGQFYITDKRFVVSATCIPLQSIMMYVKFSNQNATDPAILISLDVRVFSREPSTNLLTRVFQSIKGDDSDIPLASHDSQIASVDALHRRNQELDPVSKKVYQEVFSTSEEEVIAAQEKETEKRAQKYEDMFKSSEERFQFEARINRLNVEDLKKIKKDIIMVGYKDFLFISKLSICRNPKNTIFELNRFIGLSPESPDMKEFMVLIDRRVFDRQMTHGTIALIQSMMYAPSMRGRNVEFRDSNPLLFNAIGRFGREFALHSSGSDIVALAMYKDFRLIDRPDNPLLTTLRIDLTIDRSRISVANAFRDIMKRSDERHPDTMRDSGI